MGSTAAAAAEEKTRKYANLDSAIDLSPFDIETSGVWREHALELLTEIDRRL